SNVATQLLTAEIAVALPNSITRKRPPQRGFVQVRFGHPNPVSGQPNALTGEPNRCPGGGCLTITSESPKSQGVVVRRVWRKLGPVREIRSLSWHPRNPRSEYTPARLYRNRKWIFCNAPYSRCSLRSRVPH